MYFRKFKGIRNYKLQTRSSLKKVNRSINVLNVTLPQSVQLESDGNRRFVDLRPMFLTQMSHFRTVFQQARLNSIKLDLKNIRGTNNTPAVPLYYYIAVGGSGVDPLDEPGRKYTQGRRVKVLGIKGLNMDFKYWFSPSHGDETSFQAEFDYCSVGSNPNNGSSWVLDVIFNVTFRVVMNPNVATLTRIPESNGFTGMLVTTDKKEKDLEPKKAEVKKIEPSDIIHMPIQSKSNIMDVDVKQEVGKVVKRELQAPLTNQRNYNKCIETEYEPPAEDPEDVELLIETYKKWFGHDKNEYAMRPVYVEDIMMVTEWQVPDLYDFVTEIGRKRVYELITEHDPCGTNPVKKTGDLH